MGGKGARERTAISGELDRVKKREGGRRKGKEQRLFDTEDKLRLLALPPSLQCRLQGRKTRIYCFDSNEPTLQPHCLMQNFF